MDKRDEGYLKAIEGISAKWPVFVWLLGAPCLLFLLSQVLAKDYTWALPFCFAMLLYCKSVKLLGVLMRRLQELEAQVAMAGGKAEAPATESPSGDTPQDAETDEKA